MADKIRLLDVFASTVDLDERGLLRGQVGTVVERLGPEVFEVSSRTTTGGPTRAGAASR
jgi:hypothetical protein